MRCISEAFCGQLVKPANALCCQPVQQWIGFLRQRSSETAHVDGMLAAEPRNIVAVKVDVKVAGVAEDPGTVRRAVFQNLNRLARIIASGSTEPDRNRILQPTTRQT